MSNVLERCLGGFDLVVLGRLPDSSLEVLTAVPSWFQAIFGSCRKISNDEFYDRLPFVQFVLEEAGTEQAWQGPFQVDVGDERFQLRVVRYTEGREVVALENLNDSSHRLPERLLQIARDKQLLFERFRRGVRDREFLLRCIFHDLAGPLASIEGSLNLLADPNLPAEQRAQFLQLAIRQCSRQRDMMDEVVHLYSSELESLGVAASRVIECDALPLLKETVLTLQPAFRNRSLTLALVSEDESGFVLAEPDKLERVILNLLENALRCVPPGGHVTVSSRRDGKRLLIEVVDDGPGVAPELQPKLFSAEMRTQRRHAGKLGLGLFFCRLTLQGWGGNVAYRDAVGGGAVFVLEIPSVEYPCD